MSVEPKTAGTNMVPETKVLAIASHVSYGYVGNTMATFVMQTLGCEVAAINTVHFSNHTGYRQFKGTRTPPTEIQNLYLGLQQSHLTDFSVLLSGYIPSAASLDVVANIARDLRHRSTSNSSNGQSTESPGSFFWILDPVMGDQGQLYVSEEMVNGYKTAVREADLVLPNQFELEVLTGVPIGTEEKGARLKDVVDAIDLLHRQSRLKHVVVTSVRIRERQGKLCVIGSSSRSDDSSRLFLIEIPVLDCYFSGTGDMFAALMVGRLREACMEARVLERRSWTSDDVVEAVELPLAKATCRVLSSMQMVLEKTMVARDEEMERFGLDGSGTGVSTGAGADGDKENEEGSRQRRYLAETKAAEVRVVRNARDILCPEDRYQAIAI